MKPKAKASRHRLVAWVGSLVIWLGAASSQADQESYSFPYPANRLGWADGSGKLSIWVDDDWKVDLGNGETLPLRFHFSSMQDRVSDGLLGVGWWAPLFESTLVKLDEARLRLTAPGGQSIYLLEDRSNTATYRTRAGVWRAVGHNDEFNVEGIGGWSLRYRRGLLTDLESPRGRKLKWVRDSKGALEKIVDSKTGDVLVSLSYSDQGLLEYVVTGAVRFDFTYQAVPLLGLAPVGVSLRGFSESLQELSVNGETVGSLEQRLERNSSFFAPRSGLLGEGELQWDARTGEIQADEMSSYEYKKQGSAISIIRTFKEGRRDEYSWNPEQLTQKFLIDGNWEIDQFSGTLGPNYMALVSRKLISPSGAETEFRQYYSEGGALLRKTEITNSEVSRIEDFAPVHSVRNFAKDNSYRVTRDGNSVLLEFTDGVKRGALRFENGKLAPSIDDE